MSKYHFSHSSIYIDGTDIPKNKLNIESSKDIHEVENLLLTEAYSKLTKQLNQNTILDKSIGSMLLNTYHKFKG